MTVLLIFDVSLVDHPRMKFLFAAVIACASSLFAAAASPVEEFLAPATSGKGAVIFRVVLEKRNGIDMREFSMPKDMIAALEKEGASVRPVRTSANVCFWIFFKNGDFVSCDVVNNAQATNLPYPKLMEFFADAPHDGPKWHREGENLVIGRRYYSVRVLPANDPATGGRKGEVEIAVLDNQEKLYYYFGNFISK